MDVTLDTIVSLCKRRGFIFQGSEIYGGLAATYDYGPLGAELKRNVKEAWWRAVVHERDDIEGLDSSILMHPEVWRASGHVESFADPLVDCRSCRKRFRADHLEGYQARYWLLGEFVDETGARRDQVSIELGAAIPAPDQALATSLLRERGVTVKALDEVRFEGASRACPDCGARALSEPRMFNLMFRTHVGPVQDEASVVYLRPETAQGIFVNFDNVLTTTRRKLPFGIAQIGKSFRNEVTTKAFIFRTLEFEQMEIEYFVKPGEDEVWHERLLRDRFNWYVRYGIQPERLRLRAHTAGELAHYAKACYDIEYRFPMGWSELEGVANRTDYDLRRHREFSRKELSYFDPIEKRRYVPYVIEPSAGVDRSAMAFLMDAYDEEVVKDRTRVVLRLHHALAPIKVAVLPLLKNRPDVVEVAHRLADDLKRRWLTRYDDTAGIGKLYRRQDEIGTPFCVTVDVDSMTDQRVTLRERDSMRQDRVAIDRTADYLAEHLNLEPGPIETPLAVGSLSGGDHA